ncbi:methyltransferase domain-containing protein [Novosphingobium sp. G106]|uniref:methyltransferase domain-containing protein n=1 Tax=Novosphingobium sp. G106 TaxID=2849500 RepID=UPI001C2D7A8B|nr:methyltransferase domain-containing protein [Novosphingobium sp. G106]MBV1691331.1 methyltransferase domain-containing protein [Novosphingobium sp. G106]
MVEVTWELLACPICRAALDEMLRCTACGEHWHTHDGIPHLRLELEEQTTVVRHFYDAAPFPGYPPNDSLTWLRGRAERSAFARLLDTSLPGDATIAEIGCGTGQMSLYLARADRRVVALDLSRAALTLGAAAARRYGTRRIDFVECDLACLPLRDAAFDVVYCSGVLHHTPDPRAAFASVVRAVKPGGHIILGLYNRYARLPLRLRRLVARATAYRWIPFDPVLRDRGAEPARREAWLRDQYQHPEEHRHSLAEVRRWFRDEAIDFVSTYPSTQIGHEPDDLLAPAEDEWPLESLLAQIGWMWSLGGEGGLFVIVGRRG